MAAGPAGAGHLLRYILYGVFVVEVLRPAALRLDDTRRHIGVFEREDLEHLGARLEAAGSVLGLIVQSNLSIEAPVYAGLVRRIWERTEPQPGQA